MYSKPFGMRTILIIIILFFIQVPMIAAKNNASSSHQGISPANTLLLSAASPFEDLAEYAMTGNRKGMQQALREYDNQAAGVSKVLPPQARHNMDELVAAIRKAEEHADNETVAFKSVEAYRLLIDSLDPNSLVVPIQVSMLDYAGFRLQALLRFMPDNWPAIKKTSIEAQQYWISIRPRLKDKRMIDAVDTMIAGMSNAAQRKNKEMAIFAAKMDLALVDLLEGYFEKI